MNINSRNMSDILDSCLETVKEGFKKTLSRTLKWALHPTEEDAISELARSELVFLMVVNSLANLDAEMSVILLKEVDRWSLFPRIPQYMRGKLDAEWELPKEMLDRAAKFATILERSGMFTVPPELQSYLVELAQGAAGSEDTSPSHEQSKRPRKDPRGSPSQQGAESSIAGQAIGKEVKQERRYRLVSRGRRSQKQEGRGRGRKGKQASSHHQVQTSPHQGIGSSTINTTPRAHRQMRSTILQTVQDAATGTIPKVYKEERTISVAAVDSLAAGHFYKSPQVVSKASQTKEPQISGAAKVLNFACQTEETQTSKASEMTSAAAQVVPLPQSKAIRPEAQTSFGREWKRTTAS